MQWGRDHQTTPLTQRLRSGPVRVAVVVGVAGMTLIGCTASTELDAAGADRNDGVRLPSWIAGGRSLAVAQAGTVAGVFPLGNPPAANRPAANGTAPVDASLVSDLVAAGLTEDQASCINTGVGGSQDLLAAATSLVTAASGEGAPPALDTPTVAALLVAIGPCVADSPLGEAAAAFGANPGGSVAAPTGGVPALPIPLDLSQLEAGVAQFQQALAAAQTELARNLLLLLANLGKAVPALAPGAVPGIVPPPGTPSTQPVPLAPGSNVLRLVDRGAFVDQAARGGADRKLAGCLYDRLSLLSNDEIASIPPTGTNTALAEEVLRTIFTCATS